MARQGKECARGKPEWAQRRGVGERGEEEWQLEEFQLSMECSGRQRSWQGPHVARADGTRLPGEHSAMTVARWFHACTLRRLSALLTYILPFSRAEIAFSGTQRRGHRKPDCGNGAAWSIAAASSPQSTGIWVELI